jgi:protein-S-isoprenylcysteine O-methyltransferase Ste14
MVAFGRFVFHHRGVIFPGILVLGLLLSSPRDFLGDKDLDLWLDLVGALVVLMGLAVRAVTIGFEYIIRGGRGRQVYADNLVQGGVYAHTRNPMYLGNGLIVLGLALVINAVAFYALALPLMAVMYASIIAAEEAYLRDKFGAEFDAYCAKVNRILPRLTGFAASVAEMRFNWRRVLVKDYITIFLAALGVVLLDWWHDYKVHGTLSLSSAEHFSMAVFLIVWAVLFVVVWRLKKARWLEGDAAGTQRPT